MHKRIECSITGRVQMVMFRDFTERKASGLGLTGTVANKDDGSVLVIAEGEEKQLGELIALLRRGPMLARVDNIAVEWKDATGEFPDFQISYE